MGSSWIALVESSRQLSKGDPSAFYPYKPPARKQFVSTLVWINTAAMPFIAFNTVVSLILLAIDPTMFEHTQRVLDLPEYRPQSSIMEEGGVIGFYAIELFAFISEPGLEFLWYNRTTILTAQRCNRGILIRLRSCKNSIP